MSPVRHKDMYGVITIGRCIIDRGCGVAETVSGASKYSYARRLAIVHTHGVHLRIQVLHMKKTPVHISVTSFSYLDFSCSSILGGNASNTD